MIYGYIRVSRKEQNPARQEANISKYATDNGIQIYRTYSEAYTGTTCNRPEWNRLQKQLKAGDTVIFDSVSRMSRNAEEGFAIYEKLYADGISLVFLKERHIDTDTFRSALDNRLTADIHSGDLAADKMMNSIMSAIDEYRTEITRRQIKIAFDQAQKEVDDLHCRTAEGMKASGATNTVNENGDIIPGKISIARTGKKYTTKKETAAMDIIRRLSRDFDGQEDDAVVMAAAKISRNTFYAYKRKLKAAQ